MINTYTLNCLCTTQSNDIQYLHIMMHVSLKKCSAWNTPTLGAISAIFVPLSPV